MGIHKPVTLYVPQRYMEEQEFRFLVIVQLDAQILFDVFIYL